MKRTPNPKIIGAFVTLAGVLLVGMVLFFGSASVFRQHTRFILFFDQSVNGLDVGSPVKFRGVPIGSVERIMIRAQGQDPESTAIPVIIKINQSRLEEELGAARPIFRPGSVRDCMDAGLAAQLNLESFITGRLFVEFSIEPDRVQNYKPHLVENREIVEIPTLGSPLDQVTEDIVELVTELGSVDLPRLNDNLNRVLENLAVALEGIDSPGISAAVVAAADNFSEFLESDDFNGAVGDFRRTLAQIQATVRTYGLDDGPLAKALDDWTRRFGRTLDNLDALAHDATQMIEPGSSLRYELENALRELARASEAIRTLTEYLERNPNALITGRPEDE